MLWLYFTIASYFLFALASISDRYLLAGPLQHRRTAAFYGGITGVWAVVLVPFGFEIPSIGIIFIALLTGFLGVAWLWALYNALKFGHATTTLPMIGSLAAIFTLLFAFVFFREGIMLSPQIIFAFVLMLTGSMFFYFDKNRTTGHEFFRVLPASVILGAAFVGTKLVFEDQGLINGLIWIQAGSVLFSLLLLFSRHTREVVFKENPIKQKKVWGAILLQKSAGGGGSIMQKLAIWQVASGQLAFINALAGVQYFFVLLFVGILAIRRPSILKEELTKKALVIRILGIAGIAVGFWLLLT